MFTLFHRLLVLLIRWSSVQSLYQVMKIPNTPMVTLCKVLSFHGRSRRFAGSWLLLEVGGKWQQWRVISYTAARIPFTATNPNSTLLNCPNLKRTSEDRAGPTSLCKCTHWQVLEFIRVQLHCKTKSLTCYLRVSACWFLLTDERKFINFIGLKNVVLLVAVVARDGVR